MSRICGGCSERGICFTRSLYINEIERKPCENCERVVQLCHDRVIAPYFFKSCFC